jgi:hypothetical protein
MIESYTLVRNVKSPIEERTEITLHVPNELDLLARLFGVLATQQRSVCGWCFYSDRERATVIVIAANDNRAARSLKAAGFECNSSPVIILPHQLRRLSITQLSAELRTAGVNVLDVHACCSPQEGPLLVLKTNDNGQAIRVLEAMGLFQAEPPDIFNRLPQETEQLEAAVK